MTATLIHADCVTTIEAMAPDSVHAIVCDPPYGIGFMGNDWDQSVPGLRWAVACFRVLKPGGYLIAFGSTRTVHRLAVAIEDAGLEIRDTIGWVYYTGFPKSMDVSKAIDNAAGVERVVIGHYKGAVPKRGTFNNSFENGSTVNITAPATPAAKQWQGWGTALKPATEPAVMARKPPSMTIADCVQKHGTGGINIDASRRPLLGHSGDWPANLIAIPKPSRAERERGCADLPAYKSEQITNRVAGSAGAIHARSGKTAKGEIRNHHPTVKPVALMRWLIELVTPPAGVILDPFMGSGTAGIAATLAGVDYIGIEISEEYHQIAAARIAHAERYPYAWLPDGTDDIEAADRAGQISLFTNQTEG